VGGTCGTHGEGIDVYRDLVGRPEGKRPLGRPRRRWEDNIKMEELDSADSGWDPVCIVVISLSIQSWPVMPVRYLVMSELI